MYKDQAGETVVWFTLEARCFFTEFLPWYNTVCPDRNLQRDGHKLAQSCEAALPTAPNPSHGAAGISEFSLTGGRSLLSNDIEAGVAFLRGIESGSSTSSSP